MSYFNVFRCDNFECVGLKRTAVVLAAVLSSLCNQSLVSNTAIPNFLPHRLSPAIYYIILVPHSYHGTSLNLYRLITLGNFGLSVDGIILLKQS